MQTVYDHIAANNCKTWLLLLLFPTVLSLLTILATVLAFYAMGDLRFAAHFVTPHQEFLLSHNIAITAGNVYWLAGGFFIASYLPFVFGTAITWMLISYFFGDTMMLSFAHALPLQKQENPQVYRLVENVAIAAGLPMPKVYIVDDESLNAFATGRDPKHASIALTTGIIAKLEPLELEGVIAHEMAHIGNRDIRLNMMIITGLSVFAFLAEMIGRSLRYSTSSSKDSGKFKILLLAIMLALLVFNFFVAPIIQMAISRAREYAADATGALITRNPQALASALQKISADARVEILDGKKTMSTACIADPREPKAAFQSMLATHPPIRIRIKRLMEMGG